MKDTEKEDVRMVVDKKNPRFKPEYKEVNTILDESPVLKRWTRKMRGNPKSKLYSFRDWFYWLKQNEPEFYSLKPDGVKTIILAEDKTVFSLPNGRKKK